MEERCGNCRFCYRLYTPPTKTSKGKYEHCCIALLDDGVVMYLGNNLWGSGDRCECYRKKSK